MFSASCLIGSLAILFYVLKSRVHVHVTLTSLRDSIHASRGKGRRAEASSRETFGGTTLASCQKSTAMTRPVQQEAPNRAIVRPRAIGTHAQVDLCSVNPATALQLPRER